MPKESQNPNTNTNYLSFIVRQPELVHSFASTNKPFTYSRTYSLNKDNPSIRTEFIPIFYEFLFGFRFRKFPKVRSLVYIILAEVCQWPVLDWGIFRLLDILKSSIQDHLKFRNLLWIKIFIL